MAHAYGFRVFGTAGTPEGLKIVKNCGADEVFSHKEPNYCAKILEATKSAGVDIILEMLSNVNLGKDLPLLKEFGRVAVRMQKFKGGGGAGGEGISIGRVLGGGIPTSRSKNVKVLRGAKGEISRRGCLTAF